ncbi:MAG: DNA primase catalytic subunit PriS [Candidatus ainarchaeum sp.]|nr:DNA primase catalytic subunit PriS [Candidatus ainarchaeum sp.]MDD5096119.1 DNA primase catalytic subunit PriS [Candidatus ainarchaeum sp.]
MEERERQFVLKRFSEHYRKADIRVPSVEQREFGIGGFDRKIEARHMEFGSDAALQNYLIRDTPLYISHSVAYYKFPKATPMENKGWMGGDLIFDLDVHAGLFLSREEQEKVRADALKLADDFLASDFGIKKQYMRMVFSGNRGYHIHVRDPAYRMLGGDARREISDYISGKGLNYRSFFPLSENKWRPEGPKESDWGYRGKLCRAVIKAINEDPSRIHRRLKKMEEAGLLKRGIKDGNWGSTSIKDIVDRIEPVAKDLPVQCIDVDTGVTIDTKRLIRVPNTLHGSTGLVAKELRSLDDFEPYRDATAFGAEPVKIVALQEIPSQEFLNSTMEKMEKGEGREAPLSYAMYLVLKGAARLS